MNDPSTPPVSETGQAARALQLVAQRLAARFEVEQLTAATLQLSGRSATFPRIGIDALGGVVRWAARGDACVPLFRCGAVEDLDALAAFLEVALTPEFEPADAPRAYLAACGLEVTEVEDGLLTIGSPRSAASGTWVFVDRAGEMGVLDERAGTFMKHIPCDVTSIASLRESVELLFELGA